MRVLQSGETPPEEYRRLWQTVTAGGDWRGQFYNRKKNGEFYWASATISPIKDPEGTITHYVSLQEDITARKEAEAKLRTLNEDLARKQAELLDAIAELKATQMELVEAEKMEMIGHLAAGIAHDVKNPLGVIGLGIDYLRTHEYPAAASQVLDDMTMATERANTILADLMNLAAARELVFEAVDLHALLEQSLALLRMNAAAARVRLAREFAPALPTLQLDPQKIGQVFLNLVMNAIHAMPKGGTVTVRTSQRTLAAAETVFKAGDTVVVVEIEDTGEGIPPEVLPRLFDPFFTTKAPGKGTGLGLTVSKTILQLHGATISIGNRPEGARAWRSRFPARSRRPVSRARLG